MISETDKLKTFLQLQQTIHHKLHRELNLSLLKGLVFDLFMTLIIMGAEQSSAIQVNKALHDHYRRCD